MGCIVAMIMLCFPLNVLCNSELTIDYDPSQRVQEGGDLTMCCSSDRLLPHEYLKWINYGKGNLSRCEINETCLVLRNVNRDDLKTFTCLAEGGRATTQAVFEILYPPFVMIWHSTDGKSKRYTRLDCKSDGNPKNYTYKMWEHLSLYNEHIRYIDTPKILRFRLDVDSTNWNRDDGYYKCRVSNGIPDKYGKLFQEAIELVTTKGPPIFIADNMPLQYHDEKGPKVIMVNVVNVSVLTCTICNIATQGYDPMVTVTSKINHVISWDLVYGKKIKVNGTKISFSIYNGNFNRYVVTVCDRFGNNSYQVELISSSEKGIGKTTFYAKIGALIVGTVFIISLVVSIGSRLGNRQNSSRFRAREADTLAHRHRQHETQDSVSNDVTGPVLNGHSDSVSNDVTGPVLNGQADSATMNAGLNDDNAENQFNDEVFRREDSNKCYTDFLVCSLEEQSNNTDYYNVEAVRIQVVGNGCYGDLN